MWENRFAFRANKPIATVNRIQIVVYNLSNHPPQLVRNIRISIKHKVWASRFTRSSWNLQHLTENAPQQCRFHNNVDSTTMTMERAAVLMYSQSQHALDEYKGRQLQSNARWHLRQQRLRLDSFKKFVQTHQIALTPSPFGEMSPWTLSGLLSSITHRY